MPASRDRSNNAQQRSVDGDLLHGSRQDSGDVSAHAYSRMNSSTDCLGHEKPRQHRFDGTTSSIRSSSELVFRFESTIEHPREDGRRTYPNGARASFTSHGATVGAERPERSRAASDGLTGSGLRDYLPLAVMLITGSGSRRITPLGELSPFGRRRASTRHATDGAISEGGGTSRFSTSKNFRHTAGSSDATACTRSRYRFTSPKPEGRGPCTCG